MQVVLPECMQQALGQLVGAAKEGLLALTVGVGLGVLSELAEEEVDDVVGPKRKWNGSGRRSGTVMRTARWTLAVVASR
jgi:hypothetical protein